MKTAKILTAAVFCMMMAACAPKAQEETHNYTDITSRADLYEYFQYSPERPIVICGHRGGMVTGYPENCIESFEKTLTMMPAFFEIDPRLTKDDVMTMLFYNPRHIDDMTEEELIGKYDEALHSGCDVLVTDYPYLLQSLSFDRE